MRATSLLLALVLLCTTLAIAEQPPSTPKPDRVFAAELAAYTASNFLDGYTTIKLMKLPSTFESGSPWLYGRRPTAVTYFVPAGLVQVAASYAAYRLERSRHPFLRFSGHALMGMGIAEHTEGTVHNVGYLRSH